MHITGQTLITTMGILRLPTYLGIQISSFCQNSDSIRPEHPDQEAVRYQVRVTSGYLGT